MVVETRTGNRSSARSAGNSTSDGGGESSNGFSFEGLRIYKRQKGGSRQSSEDNLQEDARLFVEAAGQFAAAGKEIEQQQGPVTRNSSHEKNGLPRIDSLPSQSSESPFDCLQGQWRNFVLQHLSQSLDVNEGGIGSCIQDALASNDFAPNFNGTSEQSAQCQVSHNCHEDKRESRSQSRNDSKIPFKNVNVAKEAMGVTSDGSPNKTDDPANAHPIPPITEKCQRVFHDVIVSENFAMLCKLLYENFQGIKADRFSDFNIINSRMREGVYEQYPVLFNADIQQLWRNFEKIGAEMVSRAKVLSELSKTFYHELVSGSFTNGTFVEKKPEESNQVCRGQLNFGSDATKRHPSVESDTLSKPEQAEFSGLNKICTCRHCGSKAEGRDCLVCDSCEEMYHVSCVGLPGGCIPNGSWFCINCFDERLMSRHENCVVCSRINNTRGKNHLGGDEMEPMMMNNVEGGKSDCFMEAEDEHGQSSKSMGGCTCKLCGSDLKDDVRFRICMHPHCTNKYYHERCLTSQQLKSYGPKWYCPSCLCRKCLTDQDDDKIVLCDGCDHGYHIYCMNPPHSSIPRGKWFCKLCQKRIRAIRKAKALYENLGKRKKDTTPGGVNTVVGSVDMLLSAAEKLKYDEKLASSTRGKK